LPWNQLDVHRPERMPRVKAILFICLAVTLFAIMDGLGKILAGEYSVVQVVWARYAFAVPVVLALTRPARWAGLLRSESRATQLVRGTLPLLASGAVIVGLTLMPLADFTAISFVSPLLVVALSAALLRERVSARSWIGVLCGFFGILVIVRPGLGTLAWAAVFPFATALLFALYQVMTRLVSRGDSPLATLAWTVLVGFVLTTLALPFDWRAVQGSGWLLLALSGVLFAVGQLLLIEAFARAPAAGLAPFTYLQILVATAFGIAVFGDVPDLWTLAGTALVILAGLFVLRRQVLESEGNQVGALESAPDFD
jgi:drug/metabolite transporter (DMT)-like permease